MVSIHDSQSKDTWCMMFGIKLSRLSSGLDLAPLCCAVCVLQLLLPLRHWPHLTCERMQEEMSSLSRREAVTQGALSSATARADAAEKRVSQLEKEADGLAREVGMLQVRDRQERVD